MTYIKRLVMHGFKSFAKRTEVVFDKGINTVVGPNGSGKSNISDALCFVLGRLSIKSMRAAKAKNLLFMGTPTMKPAREASVEIVFDNSQNTFNLGKDEISIKRIVRHNGQSIYKINDEAKTRSDVIEMLAQAGIDPYGFNIILQGQIHSIVRTNSEERRKILEEVAGISVYESRKEKSLKELEKTEERLKEISAILRERSSYLKNLEKERSQALRYKELEETIARCKASILDKKLGAKLKELESVKKSIDEKTKQREKIKNETEEIRKKTEELSEKIMQINKHIQKSAGATQDELRETVSKIKAELEGLKVRRENYEHRKNEIEKRINEISQSIPDYEKEIAELRIKSPLMAKKQQELAKKKEELAKLEEEKKQVYLLKNNVRTLKERLKEKSAQMHNASVESDSLIKQIEEYTLGFKHKSYEHCEKTLVELRSKRTLLREALEKTRDDELAQTNRISVSEGTIKRNKEIIEKIKTIDVCPLCQNKMTEEHMNNVNSDCENHINESLKVIEEARRIVDGIREARLKSAEEISTLDKLIMETERELFNHRIVSEKQSYVKKLVEQEELLKKELASLESKREELEKKDTDASRIEEAYSSKIREIEEISSRTEEDLDTTLLYKERDLEKMKEVIKLSKKDLAEITIEIKEIVEAINSKSKILTGKEKEEAELNEEFKKMFAERDSLQEKVQEENHNIMTAQSGMRQIEDQINFLRVGNAKLEAEKESIEMELKEFSGIELIKASIEVLEEKLQKSQSSLSTIGLINMRALEVYEEIKQEYDRVKEKVDTLENEKLEIMKIIAEIDNKKKKTFMKTFNGVNDLFRENFSKLYSKGSAYLEIENKEDIFSGGVNIVIRLAKGKYFDVTSLSGGEQTMIALSLLFAIQEYKPYYFYIFDEIDAALDKRNAERLSALLRKYMNAGQYLVVTHNDALILDSNVLYGVSMHDGVSKILSLKLDGPMRANASSASLGEVGRMETRAEAQMRETIEQLVKEHAEIFDATGKTELEKELDEAQVDELSELGSGEAGQDELEERIEKEAD